MSRQQIIVTFIARRETNPAATQGQALADSHRPPPRADRSVLELAGCWMEKSMVTMITPAAASVTAVKPVIQA